MAKKKRAKTKRKKPRKKKAKKRAKKKVKKRAKKRKVKPKKKKAKKVKKEAVKKKKVTKKKVIKKAKKKLPATANLIITYDPNHRGLAEAEITDVFKRINEELKFLKSEIEGVFKIATPKPRVVVKKLAKLCLDEPELFRTTYQYVPIDKWCTSDIKEMQDVIRDVEKEIKMSDKWRMTLNKRSYDMPAMDLIITLTDVVDKPKVDLKNPDKIIRVEIFGDRAGIALLKADEAFSVPRLKGG